MEAFRKDFERHAGAQGISLAPTELAASWYNEAEVRHREEGGAEFGTLDRKVVSVRLAQLMRDLDLAVSGYISAASWIHFAVLADTGRGAQINPMLSSTLQWNPDLLGRLQELFGKLWIAQHENRDTRSIFTQILNLSPPALQIRGITAEKLLPDLIKAVDTESCFCKTYADFMASFVGRRRYEVILHMYDISNGLAKQVSKSLLGEETEGVWHTGVVAFGNEYYFAGDAIYNDIGQTKFGTPKRVIHVGYTFWHQADFHKFICDEMKPLFHRGTYDVISNNCNHYSDCLLNFLVNKSVPDDVMRQPELLKRSRLASELIGPFLNWYCSEGIVDRQLSSESAEEGISKLGDLETGQPVVFQRRCPGRSVELTAGVICDEAESSSTGVDSKEQYCVRYFDVFPTAGLCACQSLRAGRSVCEPGKLRTESVDKKDLARAHLETLDACSIDSDAVHKVRPAEHGLGPAYGFTAKSRNQVRVSI